MSIDHVLGNAKIAKTLREFKKGKLRSGVKGPKVKTKKQAVAIALSQARHAGADIPHK